MRVGATLRLALHRAGSLRMPTAVDPLLWACLIVAPVCLMGAYLLQPYKVLRYGMAGLAALPVLAVLVAYFYFLFKDPDRLQAVKVQIGPGDGVRRTYLLVTPQDPAWFIPGAAIVDQALDEEDQVFVFADNIAFLQTARNIEAVTDKLTKGVLAGRHFFLTEIHAAIRTGTMDPQFWDYIEQAQRQAA